MATFSFHHAKELNMKLTMPFPFAFLVTLVFASLAFGAPHVAVDQPAFNFGTIAQGKKIDHIFALKNSGDATLTIGQVSTSCGCTVANVSSRSIVPGQSGEIKATFNSANFTGSISKSIYVHTNDPGRPVYTLTIKGTVFERIEVTPKQLNLGEIKAGTRKETVIRIENKGAQPLTVLSARTAMSQVVAKIRTKTVKPGGTGTISVAVTPRNGDHFLGGYLTITTNSPEKPEIIVPIYASAT
jgi:hypothetical protein